MVDMTSAATTPQTALADDVRTAGEDARKQAAVLSHAIERITAIHESQVTTLQQDIQLVRAELADAHGAAKRTSAKANRVGWAFGMAAVVVAGLGATLTHTLLDAEKQGATLRQVSDKLTHQVALTNEAKALAGSKGAVFIDTRSTLNFGRGHIPGAVTASYREESDKTPAFDGSKDKFEFGKLPQDKAAKIVFYSDGPTGWKSYKAAVLAIKQGYTGVHYFRGGFDEWSSKGLTVER
jgi:rhodanese-related sulfurtransferase